jgi:integrase
VFKKMKLIKVGNTTVKIYERTWGEHKGKKYDLFSVVHKQNGKRIWKNFRHSDAARRYAADIATKIEKGQREVLSLTNTDRETYLAAMAAIKPLGIPLHVAVQDYVALKAKSNTAPKRIREVVDELLARKEADGLSRRYVETLRTYLVRFADAFQTNIGSMTTPLIVRWLDSLKLGPRSRNNVRQSILTLFHFARRRGYLPKGQMTEADDVETVRDHAGEIAVLKPAELAKLLKKAKPIHQLYFALGAFTGIRSAELMRLEWSEINFEKNHIEVKARKAKTATRRLVPIQPNLAQWLSPYRGQAGKLFRSRRVVDAAIAFAKAQGITWTANVLRHSYASYRLSILPDAARVALEMGNSPAKLFTNYRELDRENHAPEWFAIKPEPKRSRKVIAFRAA